MKTFIFLPLIFLLPLNILSASNKFELSGKVISIKDGDTIVILNNNKQTVIRLAHIDCPEKNQPFGTAAKKFVSQLCFSKNVIVNGSSFDRNKRLIAEVFLPDGKNLNQELVKAGLAWHFKKYSSSLEYARLEQIARTKNIGLWSESNPIPPWLWRKSKRVTFAHHEK